MSEPSKQDWSPRKTPGGRGAQPEWELAAYIGDRNPLDYGGAFIFADKTNVYEEEMEVLAPDEGDPPNRYTIYRVTLERSKFVDGYLVPIGYDPLWPRPTSDYEEWYRGHLPSVADFVGQTVQDLERALTSPDAQTRGLAYQALGYYFGWHELDHDPLVGVTRAEVMKRYKKELRAVRAGKV